MEDEVIEDCIVVADNAISTFSNKTASEINGNDHDGLADDTAAQEKNPVQVNKPHSPSQAPITQTKFRQMSPTKTRKAQSQVRRRPRSKFQKQFDGEDDCDYDPSDDSVDSLSDDSEPLKSRFNLRSKATRKQQDVRFSLRRSQNIDNMGTKRPRRPDSGDDQSRKRGVHKSLDAAGDRGRGGLRTSTRHRSPQRLVFMGRRKPEENHQKSVSRREGTHHGHNKPAASSRRGKDSEATKIPSETDEVSSSDIPLTVRRGPNKGHAQARLTQETEDDSDDIPIASTVRRRLRTRDTSTPESASDTTFPQPQKDETQPRCHCDKALEKELNRAYQELSSYREALKKERAKSYGLEQQSLLWQARQLAAQDEEHATELREAVESSVETRTRELNTELNKRQNTIEQLKSQVNYVQEELDWYKARLDEFRTKYVEDMRARDRTERDRVLYILGDC